MTVTLNLCTESVEITKIWNAIQALNGDKEATADTFKYEPVAAPAFDLSKLDDIYAKKSDIPDLSKLDKLYAKIAPPHRTIQRIEDLERQMRSLNKSPRAKVVQKEESAKAASE